LAGTPNEALSIHCPDDAPAPQPLARRPVDLDGLARRRPAQAADEALRVGSKRFTESYILAELLAQTAAPHTASPPVVRQGLGNTAIVYEALRSGAIDLYAEYTGTIALEILKGSPADTREAMNAALAPMGLGVAIPLGFNDGYALAVRAADAERLGLRTLSDLAKHPELKLGLSNEFLGRADGWKGLAARYGFTQTPTGLDHGLAYDAWRQADRRDRHLHHRREDRPPGPARARGRPEVLPALRRGGALQAGPAHAPAQGLGRAADARRQGRRARDDRDECACRAAERALRCHRARLHRQRRHHRVAAQPQEARRGFTAKLFGPDLWKLARQHLLLVAVSVGIAILIGVPIAILVFSHVRLRAVVLGIASLMQTVPSLALLAVLISMLGAIGALPALIALTLYSLLPIMRNTVTGLAEVPNGLRLAGTALGMTPPQSLQLVLLPLALPTLLAGVRTATAIAIGTATIAAFIGAGGFGERIVTGLALNDRELLLAGALPAAAMALISEGIFELIEWTMRRRRRAPSSLPS
jgi:osmoprotectant transport system permease protein